MLTHKNLFAFLLILLLSTVATLSDAAKSSWKFAVVCDTRGNDTDTPGKACINRYILKQIAASIVEEGCELVIVPGDMVNGWWANGGTVYEKQFEEWMNAMGAVYEKNIPVYSVRGNHESGAGVGYPPQPPYAIVPNTVLQETYLTTMGKTTPQNGPAGEKGLTYYVTHKNAFFIGFDTYVQANRINVPWFREVVTEKFNATLTPHLITFGHAPAFKVNHPDCLAFYKERRDDFWNLLGISGGRVYFCGHDHLYNRAAIKDSRGNNLLQVLAGSGGAPFKSWEPPYSNPIIKGIFHNETNYGYIVATVEGKKITYEWKAWDVDGNYKWKTLDSFFVTVGD